MITDEGGVNISHLNPIILWRSKGLWGRRQDKIWLYWITQEHRLPTKLRKCSDSESDVIFTVGYALYEDTANAADANPDQNML